jgi:hypothetical protein
MYLVLLVTWFDMWEYVLQGNQEYGHVVALQAYVLHTLGVRMVLSRLWWTCPRVGMKGKRLLRNYRWMFQVCELGLPLQGWKFDSESSVSRED